MCLTLIMRGPNTSAAAAKVRAGRCNHALRVNRFSMIVLRQVSPRTSSVPGKSSSFGWGPINSISMRSTTQVLQLSTASTLLFIDSWKLLAASTSSCSQDLLVARRNPLWDGVSEDSHTNPQLSPKLLAGVIGKRLDRTAHTSHSSLKRRDSTRSFGSARAPHSLASDNCLARSFMEAASLDLASPRGMSGFQPPRWTQSSRISMDKS
mmetsp:Transcript_372/g.1278  ORF Transcript_372/g.1278 Transcript_372/m.1278 type:complete len:208 (+) Transcript_372:853-1476(+)